MWSDYDIISIAAPKLRPLTKYRTDGPTDKARLKLLYLTTRDIHFDKPKVVSLSQSQKLTTWFSLKSNCLTKPTHSRESFKEVRKSYTSKIKVVSLCKQVQKKFLNLTPTPKIALKSPKSAKRPKIWPNEKLKDRAVLQKLKMIVCITRSKKYIRA